MLYLLTLHPVDPNEPPTCASLTLAQRIHALWGRQWIFILFKSKKVRILNFSKMSYDLIYNVFPIQVTVMAVIRYKGN